MNEKMQEFWDETKGQLSLVPINDSIEALEIADPLVLDAHVSTRTVYEVALNSFGNRRIRGWLIVPAGIPPEGGWPAIMELPPYKETVPLPIHLSQHGFATLSLFPRGQAISRKEWETERDTKVVFNIDDINEYYYRGAYMDCLRGIDFLSGRPEINARRIGVWGFSAGGGLCLATASLDHRIKAAVAGVPWPCDFRKGSQSTVFPFAFLKEYLDANLDRREHILETLDYFDITNLTERIRCPTLIGAAIEDDMHPIESTYTAFQRIPGKKSILVYADLNHEYKTDFTFNGLNWMARHL